MSVLQKSIDFLIPLIKQITGPVVIGISGPQGSGKTTVSSKLTDYVNENTDLHAITLLLDDFYLTYNDQIKLNQLCVDKYDGNKLLQGRGLPGTHDIDLLTEVLENFLKGMEFHTVGYDKSLQNGKGDRIPETKTFNPPKVDVIFLEGWFLGFKPLVDIPKSTDPIVNQHKPQHLKLVDDFLIKYQRAFGYCQYSVIIETPDIDNVFQWRLQQEHQLIRERGMGMTDNEVKLFVDRYMPVYKLYYHELCNSGLSTKGNNLVVKIDIDRSVVGAQII